MNQSRKVLRKTGFVLLVHGGAGGGARCREDPQLEAEFIDAIHSALAVGKARLRAGESAVDAVCDAVANLEDSPCFNSARGAAIRRGGEIRLDASVMDGHRMNCGAIAGASVVCHPVLGARAVMDLTDHVLVIGNDADDLAREAGLDLAGQEYFETPFRRQQFDRIKKGQVENRTAISDDFFSTVGAVAIDRSGHLAAATSTGGSAYSRVGRVGDSPLIGAGTYADNRSCAVSATGHGESFVRVCAARTLAARFEATGDIEYASRMVLDSDLARVGGTGGFICIDHAGYFSMPFNTEGMARGYTGDEVETFAAVF